MTSNHHVLSGPNLGGQFQVPVTSPEQDTFSNGSTLSPAIPLNDELVMPAHSSPPYSADQSLRIGMLERVIASDRARQRELTRYQDETIAAQRGHIFALENSLRMSETHRAELTYVMREFNAYLQRDVTSLREQASNRHGFAETSEDTMHRSSISAINLELLDDDTSSTDLASYTTLNPSRPVSRNNTGIDTKVPAHDEISPPIAMPVEPHYEKRSDEAIARRTPLEEELGVPPGWPHARQIAPVTPRQIVSVARMEMKEFHRQYPISQTGLWDSDKARDDAIALYYSYMGGRPSESREILNLFKHGVEFKPLDDPTGYLRTVIIEQLFRQTTMDEVLAKVQGGKVSKAVMVDTSAFGLDQTVVLTFQTASLAADFIKEATEARSLGQGVRIRLSHKPTYPTAATTITGNTFPDDTGFNASTCANTTSKVEAIPWTPEQISALKSKTECLDCRNGLGCILRGRKHCGVAREALLDEEIEMLCYKSSSRMIWEEALGVVMVPGTSRLGVE